MVYGSYLSAGGMLVNQYRMEVLANNLANAETTGFKQDLTVVRERMPQHMEDLVGFEASDPRLDGMTGGSLVAPTHTSFTQGPIEKTDRALDVALRGPGFFRVQTEAGERYTRDGRFMVDEQGGLVTVAGHHPVLDESGSPITVPAGLRDAVRISASGDVGAGDQSLGTLGRVAFEDTSLLRKQGGNLIQSLGAEPQSLTSDLAVGAVERSTVDPVREMVSMIEVSRAYQMNATLLGLSDSTLGRAVNDVGRVR